MLKTPNQHECLHDMSGGAGLPIILAFPLSTSISMAVQVDG